MPELEVITEEDRFFVKFFLLDGKSNLNDWGVTEQALKNNIASFIDKPFILRSDFSHPDAFTGDQLLFVQERDRVGNIFEVGIDQSSGKAWGMAEITDKNAQEVLKKGEVSFVSPSIVFSDFDIIMENGQEKVSRFEGAHVAAVREPAYGMQKAQIKGKCTGSPETCTSQLMKVQASVQRTATPSKCGKFIKIVDGNKVDIIKKSEYERLKEAKCLVDQLGNCVTKSSLNQKNTSKEPIMAEDDKKDKDDANEEELEERRKEESKKAEEEEKKEEARKAEEEEKEKEDARKAEEEKEKEDAEEDEDKKEARKAVREMKAELKTIKAEFAKTSKTPLVESILSAKIQARHIVEAEKTAEASKLYSLSAKTLKEIASQYEKVGNAKRPYSVLEYKSASIDKTNGDSFLMELGCGGN